MNYDGDVNLLGDDIDSIRKTENLIDPSMDVGQGINAGKSK
jgi:hypothetical protein